MSNFILKVFLCLLLFVLSSTLTMKLALKLKDFAAPTAIFKDFQGAREPCYKQADRTGTKTSQKDSRFTLAKGQTTNLLRKTKRRFFREKIDENKGNPKGVWKALKSLSGTSKPRVRINEITTENEVVSEEFVITNELNEYFVLKKIAPVFANPSCKLLNLSISTNSFPNHWRLAKVTALHEGGARNDINNYRPISVLPILSKILEKHVASSLSVFLRDNNLLYEL